MSLTVGETVGTYRIVEQLGQGGMATVFKAYHAALDRYVAIKVMHPAFKEDSNFLARFTREARVVAKIEHPNIVPIYDFAEHNGAPYLVMKFIEGETLKSKLARGPLSLQETLHILEAVGAGLSYAHRQGILHRDIKPSNIMLGADGGIYLADFGLARIAQAGESTLSSDSMLGTPHYMSPEQARGVKDLDGRTDIYSLGVVLYELVVGRLPFSADTPFAIIHDHIYTPLPMPHTVNPNVPEAVERVLLKALAKERDDRYPDATAMVAAFREAVAGATPDVIALPPRVPVSPSAPTPSPSGVTVKGEAPQAATVVTPATPPPAPVPRAKVVAPLTYRFRWWHALVGVVVIGCLCLGFAAITSPEARAMRQTQAAENSTATALAQVTQPPLPPASHTPVSPAPDTQPAPPSPIPEDARALQAEAERAFREGRPREALELLNQALALNPDDLTAYWIAGDMTFAAGLTMDALSVFYIPGVQRTKPPFDEVAMTLRGHATLAFYVLAAEPGAADFLRQQSEAFPDPFVVRLALTRFNVFHGQPDVALEEIQALLKDDPGNPAVLLISGDYHLRVGQAGEAALRYKAAQEVNQAAPQWVRLEAACGARKAVEQRANAKLEPTCNPVPELLRSQP